MYIEDCTRLELPYAEARQRLLSVHPERDRRITLTVTGLPIAKDVEVDLGEAMDGNGVVAIPVRWRATWPVAAFPAFEGDLELAQLTDGSAELWLMGRYQPPLGAIGRMLDRTVLHTMARDSVHQLLEVMASHLEHPASAA